MKFNYFFFIMALGFMKLPWAFASDHNNNGRANHPVSCITGISVRDLGFEKEPAAIDTVTHLRFLSCIHDFHRINVTSILDAEGTNPFIKAIYKLGEEGFYPILNISSIEALNGKADKLNNESLELLKKPAKFNSIYLCDINSTAPVTLFKETLSTRCMPLFPTISDVLGSVINVHNLKSLKIDSIDLRRVKLRSSNLATKPLLQLKISNSELSPLALKCFAPEALTIAFSKAHMVDEITGGTSEDFKFSINQQHLPDLSRVKGLSLTGLNLEEGALHEATHVMKMRLEHIHNFTGKYLLKFLHISEIMIDICDDFEVKNLVKLPFNLRKLGFITSRDDHLSSRRIIMPWMVEHLRELEHLELKGLSMPHTLFKDSFPNLRNLKLDANHIYGKIETFPSGVENFLLSATYWSLSALNINVDLVTRASKICRGRLYDQFDNLDENFLFDLISELRELKRLTLDGFDVTGGYLNMLPTSVTELKIICTSTLYLWYLTKVQVPILHIECHNLIGQESLKDSKYLGCFPDKLRTFSFNSDVLYSKRKGWSQDAIARVLNKSKESRLIIQ